MDRPTRSSVRDTFAGPVHPPRAYSSGRRACAFGGVRHGLAQHARAASARAGAPSQTLSLPASAPWRSAASDELAGRQRIRELDLSAVAMVYVSYLDITGNPAHLRYLLERLRERKPGLPILVGLWPVGDKVLSDAALGRSLGADYYVTSLRDAVEACLEAEQALPGNTSVAA